MNEQGTEKSATNEELARKDSGYRAFVFVAAIAIVALAIFLGVRAYQRITTQSEARDDVAAARHKIERVDVTIRQVDALVRAQATPEIAEEVTALVAKIPSAKQEASEAALLFDRSVPNVTAEERSSVRAAASSARLRAALLDAAQPLLDATAKASLAIGPAEEGWTLLLAAEDDSDRAAKLYNAHDKKKAAESRKLSQKAADEVRRAHTLLDSANKAMPEAGLGPVVNYCNERIKLLELADKADAAFLAGDIAKANALSAEYNTKEKALTATAQTLPKSPSAAIGLAYDSLTDAPAKRYEMLRETLTEA